MAHVVRIHETGGTEVLRWEEVQIGDPGPGLLCGGLSETAQGLLDSGRHLGRDQGMEF